LKCSFDGIEYENHEVLGEIGETVEIPTFTTMGVIDVDGEACVEGTRGVGCGNDEEVAISEI